MSNVRRKFEEHRVRATVPDGKFALPDKQIFEYHKKEIIARSGKEFEEWLGMKIEDITTENIKSVVDTLKKEIKFSIDLRLLEFIRIVYFHPALKGRDWEEMYAIVHNLKIPVYEGPYVFANPVPVRGDKLEVDIPNEEWYNRIENASANFLPGLIKKILDS